MGNITSYIQTEPTNNYRKYGWTRDIPDHRDKYRIPVLNKLESSVDLRDKCPGIYNQGKLGSCTANAIAAAYEYEEIQRNEANFFIPSRLFIYYNERAIENTINYDSGAQIRDGIKSIRKLGVCPETDWPYDITRFTDKPLNKCYTIATRHRSIQYERIEQDINHIKSCLLAGVPFVFGFAVYDSFENPEVSNTGIMPLPSQNEKVLGGHAVLAVGYNDKTKVIIVRNSWGIEWGDLGYFYMPYAFITNPNMCSDFWAIQQVDTSTK
jgi:C1A family cysteine protease